MSFGNHKPEHHDSRGSLPLNDDLDKLNQLGGLNDLMGPETQGNLDRLAHDGNKLGHDLKHPSLDKAGLDHTLGDVGKFADDLNNSPLGKLDNLAGDLAANDANGQNGDADKDKVKRPENDLDALNDLGNVGSLASRADKGDHGKQKGQDINPAEALKDASNLADDLKHNQPHKLGKDVGKLGKDAGLGALSFGPMEDTAFGKGKNPLDHPLDRKVTNGSIMPEDLRNQRGNDSYHPRPPKTLLDRLKDGGKYVGRKFKDGLKSAFSHATSGVMSAVHHLTGASIAKATAAKIVASGMIIPALAGGGLIGVAVNQDSNYQVLDAGNICGVANDNGMGFADSDSTGGGANGDWTKPGTTAYKTAKSLFMSWVHAGCSGAAAAGIVGYITGEGGTFNIPDRAEGHNGNDEKTNGIAYGVTPTPVGSGYSVGGGGVYQLTPYTGFAPVGDKKWLSVEAQTKYFKKVKLPGWNKAYDYSGKAPTFKAFAHLTDPEDATKAWDAAEIGVVSNMAGRVANAKKAYKMFDGSKYQANDSLLGKVAGGVADANSSIAETINNILCKSGNGDSGPVVAGSWGKPFPGFTKANISSPFGDRGGWHDGIDVVSLKGPVDIHAIHGGKVAKIGCTTTAPDQSQIGYYVIVQSPDGYSEIYQEYAFTKSSGDKVTKVHVGDHVKTGQVIGRLSTSTPGVTHIHIGVFKGSASQLWTDGEAHAFTPNYPKWKDPAKLIFGGK